MRILSNEYLSNVSNTIKKTQGGTAKFAQSLSQFVTEHGHTWIGVLGTKNNPTITYKELASTNDQISYTEIYLPHISSSVLQKIDTQIELHEYFKNEIDVVSDFMKREKPDVVFLNGFSSFAWLLYVAAKKCDIPVAIQHAGIMKIEVEQYRDFFSDAGAAMCFEMEKETTANAAMNIFLNTYSEQMLAKVHNLGSIQNSCIVPLPDSGWKLSDEPVIKTTKEVTLGVVARWDRIKNHESILALAEEIKKQSLPWKIQVVTTIINSPNKLEMKTRYKELIQIIHPMDHANLRDFYSQLDIALLPSHFDVSPHVVMEAISVNVPTLISPHVGWVSEYEENDMQDWIISFEDPQKVIERISFLLEKENWPETKKLANYIKVCHNKDTIYSSYLHIFEELQQPKNA